MNDPNVLIVDKNRATKAAALGERSVFVIGRPATGTFDGTLVSPDEVVVQLNSRSDVFAQVQALLGITAE